VSVFLTLPYLTCEEVVARAVWQSQKRRERAVGHDAGPVSNRTIRRSADQPKRHE